MDLNFFAEMAWKSALIAGAALMLAFVLRSRAAADRALVLRIGVAMLLLLPLIALGLPALEIVAFAAPEAMPAMPYVPVPELAMADFGAPPVPAPEPTIWDDPTPLVLLAYLGGLAMIGSRLLAGLWLLDRWTRSAREVDCPEWLAAFDRVRWAAGNAESIRLLASEGVTSPLSWGWRRPVILLDTDTLGQPEDADAILAHEVAHIARRDWPVLMLARIVATLFWFNPLVWLLEREVIQQAEEAADLEAAQRMEPARYAETLLSWAQVNGAIPANSIAPSTSALGRRVRAVLDRRSRERPAGAAWTAIAMVLCIGIATPVAAMKLVAATQDAPEAPIAPDAPEAPDAPLPPGAPDAPLPAEAPRAPDAPYVHRDGGRIVIEIPPVPDVTPIVNQALASVLPRIPAIVASATAAVDSEEVREALREAQEDMRRDFRLNREELAVAMRETRRAVAQARAVHRVEIRNAMREAERARVHAQREVRVAMRHGADGMLEGAAGMERGARDMEREADRLRDRDYREREIARQRARGRTVTHEQLIEASREMREGAEGMREGAREMREAAQRMRDGRH
ncbi:MAG: M56 family metallopeptidase [Sphingosinicella sp.]|uniref:M56 family metallopeptidase n=1 Tax=Sphingosinicella sp. TaxID=1917971 RepID=UPI004037770E